MSKATTDKKIDFDEVYKSLSRVKEFKVPTKIKMKQHYYDKLATEVQRKVNITEVRDVDMQPLNTLYGLKVVIDNSISKEWEIIYE